MNVAEMFVESNEIPENETTERLDTHQEDQDAIASKPGIKARAPPPSWGRGHMGTEIISCRKKTPIHMVHVIWSIHIGHSSP